MASRMETVKEMEQQMHERLKAELALLQAHRSDLLRQIEEVDSLVRQNTAERAKFAHVNKIPDDVLKLILEDAYQHPTSPDPSSLEHCDMPTALTATHVCRRWRRIAVSLPALWHCVHADLHETIIALHISRSCDLPLQLEANALSGSVTQFTDLLLKSAHRYKSALFWSSTVLSSAYLASALDGTELQLLKFISIIDLEASLVDSTIKLASVSPNLRALVLYGKFDMQNFPSLPNLRTLCIVSRHGITNEQLAQLSAATPQLHELIIGLDINPPTNAVVLFPSLQKIQFCGTDWEDLFRLVDAPQLRSFMSSEGPFWAQYSADLDAGNPPRTYHHMTHMLLHSGMAGAAGDGGFGIFHQAPNLTNLDLVNCRGMSQMLEWLCDSSANEHGTLLSKLETVSMTDVNRSDFRNVIEFVQRRSRFQPPLQELKLGEETIKTMGVDVVRMLSQLVTVSTAVDISISVMP